MQHLTIVLIGLLMMNSCAKEEEVVVVSTRFGDMVLEFYPDVAPKHVESFKIHAQNGYFKRLDRLGVNYRTPKENI